MRKDMPRILVERSRTGGFGKTFWDRSEPDEESPTREGMRWPHRYNTRNLNDHLSPLTRFLEANVGHPWDDVYSEIRRNVDIRTILGHHLIEHVKNYVSTQTEDRWRFARFIVVDGLLQRNMQSYAYRKFPSYRTPPNPDEIVKPDEKLAFQRIDGIWYIIHLAEVRKAEINSRDVLTRYKVVDEKIIWNEDRTAPLRKEPRICMQDASYPAHGLYAVSKKQCNTQELRRAGLVNRRAA